MIGLTVYLDAAAHLLVTKELCRPNNALQEKTKQALTSLDVHSDFPVKKTKHDI